MKTETEKMCSPVVRMPPALKKRIEQAAKRNKCGFAEWIRGILEFELDVLDSERAVQRARGKVKYTREDYAAMACPPDIP